MLAIKTDKENWEGETLLGQMGDDMVLEVESAPSYLHEVLPDDELITQRCFSGDFGINMTYGDICRIRDLINELGDEAHGARSVAELNYRKGQRDYITTLELALVDLYEGGL